MKKLLFAVAMAFISAVSFSQDDLKRLVLEGIDLHDRGYYEEAIRKYDSVLEKDKNHYQANYEKSYTLLMLGKYDECITICKLLADIEPGNADAKYVFVNWGTALDDKGEADAAIGIYDKGISKYPGFYLLHYNKGITLAGLKRYDESLLTFQQTLTCNPMHASSHHFIGRILMNDNRIPAFMAFFTFLLVETKSERASQNYSYMNDLIMKGIKESPDGKGTTISIDASSLDLKKNKHAENDFSSVDMIFSLSSALDKDEKYKEENEAERLDRKVQLLAGMFKEQKKDGKGFYWEFYAPFFIDLKKNDHLLTACYLASVNANSNAVNKWLKENTKKVNEFYSWLKDYKWAGQQ
jgi:tetratricopeptide (TPR) repeat protein